MIFVDSRDDVFIFPLKMLGYSLNSVEPSELEAARQILLEVAPHLYGLDSNTYGQTMADGPQAMTLGWTGPLRPGAEGHEGQGLRGAERRAAAFWLDTWVMLTDAPDPEASYAWLNFIQHPEIQGEETNYNLYATPNDAAKEFVKPEILRERGDLTAGRGDRRTSRASKDTSSSTQRNDIWEEFK